MVFACHGDQVLPLLADPTDAERDVFRHFTTTRNETWLHTDAALLPAAAAGARLVELPARRDSDAPPSVTYDLNRLQGLTTRDHAIASR